MTNGMISKILIIVCRGVRAPPQVVSPLDLAPMSQAMIQPPPSGGRPPSNVTRPLLQEVFPDGCLIVKTGGLKVKIGYHRQRFAENHLYLRTELGRRRRKFYRNYVSEVEADRLRRKFLEILYLDVPEEGMLCIRQGCCLPTPTRTQGGSPP